jgi:IS1 family transposase
MENTIAYILQICIKNVWIFIVSDIKYIFNARETKQYSYLALSTKLSELMCVFACVRSYFENYAQRIHCCNSTATIKSFVLLSAACD